jgi:hypothetical protein
MAKIKSILSALFKPKTKKKGKAKKQTGPKETPKSKYRGQGKRR